jgi:hypothetical protein
MRLCTQHSVHWSFRTNSDEALHSALSTLILRNEQWWGFALSTEGTEPSEHTVMRLCTQHSVHWSFRTNSDEALHSALSTLILRKEQWWGFALSTEWTEPSERAVMRRCSRLFIMANNTGSIPYEDIGIFNLLGKLSVLCGIFNLLGKLSVLCYTLRHVLAWGSVTWTYIFQSYICGSELPRTQPQSFHEPKTVWCLKWSSMPANGGFLWEW